MRGRDAIPPQQAKIGLAGDPNLATAGGTPALQICGSFAPPDSRGRLHPITPKPCAGGCPRVVPADFDGRGRPSLHAHPR